MEMVLKNKHIFGFVQIKAFHAPSFQPRGSEGQAAPGLGVYLFLLLISIPSCLL